MNATDVKYLRDLADRIMCIPVIYGTDQSDVDTLLQLARKIENELQGELFK